MSGFSQRDLRAALVVFATSAVIGGIAMVFLAQVAPQPYEALSARGLRAQGVVTSVNPNARRDLAYSFTAGARTFVAGDLDHSPGPYSLGQPIQVTYDPVDPRVNCACEPSATKPGISGILLGALFIGGGFALVYLLAYPLIRPGRA